MATVILKATEKCNSGCCYCDVVGKPGAGRSMPLELLEIVFIRIDEYLRESPDETVEVIWHGGEPLLLGPGYFRTAAELLEKRCSRTQDRIHHTMQTNLTCFTTRYAKVFRTLGIASVGTSYDPLPGIRGPAGGKRYAWYNKKFMAGLQALEESGFGWGLIYVITKHSLAEPLAIFRFLVNLGQNGGVNFNPVLIYDQERRHLAVTAEEYKSFLGVVFPYWWERRNRFFNVEPFRSLVSSIIDRRPSLSCVDSGTCTFNQVNVAPDGETSQCGRSSDWGLLSYGNLRNRSLRQVLRDPQREQFVTRLENLLQDECRECRFWDLCHGGCPLDAYAEHGSFMHKSVWCEAKKGFIQEYFEPLTGTRYDGRK